MEVLPDDVRVVSDADDIDTIVDKVFGHEGIIYEYKMDYKERPEQIVGVRKAMEALQDGEPFLLEGPCGFGKTFVYLFSVMYFAKTHGRTAVISTNGIALQGQLYHKDAPLIAQIIEKVIDAPVRVAYMKGKQNYLCKHRLQDTVANNFDGVQMSFTENKVEMSLIVKWAIDTKTGDMAELSFKPNFDIWNNFSCSDSEECLGRSCEFQNECFHTRAKRVCRGADVIITNYHLLFADIETEGKILPPYDLLICDEAHNIAEISRNFQEKKVSHYLFLNFMRRLSAAENKYPNIFKVDRTGIRNLVKKSEAFFLNLTDYMQNNTQLSATTRTVTLSIPLEHEYFLYELRVFVNEINEMKNEISPEFFTDDDEEFGEPADSHSDERAVGAILNGVLMRGIEAVSNIRAICTQTGKNSAFYVQMENNNMISLRAKPVKVDDYMRQNFFMRNAKTDDKHGDLTTILTSATLAAGQSFNYIKTELGVDFAREMIADSPFDLEYQQLWYLPEGALDGNAPNFLPNMLSNFLDLVRSCGGGVLGLFTSVYNMKAAAVRLRQSTNLTVFMQGDAPQDKLLKDFAHDTNSVLIGTRSLFEGVDVAGDSLRCVFLDKLPFASPEDPVAKVLAQEAGAFWKYSIPSMIIALKQAVGRGVRTTTDKCVIAFGDGRIKSAKYASRIMNSFNYEKTITRSLSVVEKFLGREDDMPF